MVEAQLVVGQDVPAVVDVLQGHLGGGQAGLAPGPAAGHGEERADVQPLLACAQRGREQEPARERQQRRAGQGHGGRPASGSGAAAAARARGCTGRWRRRRGRGRRSGLLHGAARPRCCSERAGGRAGSREGREGRRGRGLMSARHGGVRAAGGMAMRPPGGGEAEGQLG